MKPDPFIIPVTAFDRRLIEQAAAISGQSAEEFATATLVRVATDLNQGGSASRAKQLDAIDALTKIPVDRDAERRGY
jgi:uncharacterized protein (DUF1778 family)